MRHFDPFDLVSVLKDAALLLFSIGTAIWAWFRVRHAYSWPSAQGAVMGVHVSSGGPIIKPWIAEITYSYIVNGEYYSGVRRLNAFSKRRAERKIEGLKGQMVVVRYSPDQYDLSTLLADDQPGGQLAN
jgi:hypothetical protein